MIVPGTLAALSSILLRTLPKSMVVPILGRAGIPD
jgi:hypothetical protein